jgi:hypothetical protein
LTQEARSNEFIDMMVDVMQIKVDDSPAYYKYLDTLDPKRRNDTERAVRRVSYFLDNVGLYVRQGIIDKDIALASFGAHAANAWRHLEWRQKNAGKPLDAYPHNFRWFAELSQEAGHQAYENLRDWRQRS